MKKILLFTLLMSITAISFTGLAKKEDLKNTYNLRRAIEENERGDRAAEIEFLVKELDEHPKNGYAHLMLGANQTYDGEYSNALSSLNNALKYLPKKDKMLQSYAYICRSDLYVCTGDTAQAFEDLAKALAIYPDYEEGYERRGQLYFEMEDYDNSDADYRRFVKIKPGDVTGYMGLGRNAMARGNYDEAIKQYNRVISMYDDYSSGFSYRAECYLKQGKYVEAADDIIKALALDTDMNAYYLTMQFPKDQIDMLAAKLKAASIKEPYDSFWPSMLGRLYKHHNMLDKALVEFKKAYEVSHYEYLLEEIATCYRDMSDFASTIAILEKADKEFGEDSFRTLLKADLTGYMGDVEGAIEKLTLYLESHPDDKWGYYRRGFYEDNLSLTDKALADYNMAVNLEPDYAYGWLGKGDMHMRLGETEKAMEAYAKVVELDTIPDNNSCAMYALLALGREDEAVEHMERILEVDPDDPGIHFDGACFYSRLGDYDKAMSHLRTALEKGFRRFWHIRADDDLEELRRTEAFERLMEEFETPSDSDASKSLSIKEEVRSASQFEVPFTPAGGVYSVKCSVNKLPLTFIFDTGASTVSLSQTEANFMLKNGYLKKNDFIGKGEFVDARGDVSEKSIVNLREIEFGDLKLNNVKASVVRNQKAPLLLGQSVLQRLGSIEIDNTNCRLIIKK